MPWQHLETEPLDIGTGVAPASARAIAAALLRRAVPLMVRRHGRAEPLATGTLYHLAGRIVLVTCRHIFDGAALALGDLAVPLPSVRQMIGLDRCARRILVHPQRDLALIEIGPGRVRDTMLRHWPAVPLDAGDLHDDHPDEAASVYVLAGWPYAQMRRLDDTVYARPVVFFAGRADARGDQALHLLYARVARRTDGIDVHAPELDGVSGATVWRVCGIGQTEEGGVLLQPAGVQCAFKHDAYARAERLAQARGLMERVRQ